MKLIRNKSVPVHKLFVYMNWGTVPLSLCRLKVSDCRQHQFPNSYSHSSSILNLPVQRALHRRYFRSNTMRISARSKGSRYCTFWQLCVKAVSPNSWTSKMACYRLESSAARDTAVTSYSFYGFVSIHRGKDCSADKETGKHWIETFIPQCWKIYDSSYPGAYYVYTWTFCSRLRCLVCY